jgi:hypothetical protein
MAGLGLKPRSRYYEFHGRRLYMLKPDRDERLNELEVLEFALPDDIEVGLYKSNPIDSQLERKHLVSTLEPDM